MKRHTHYDHYLEVIGLHCPQPIINCKAKLVRMAKGEILKFVASDSSSLKEIPLLINALGEELIAVREIAGYYRYTIRRISTATRGRPAPAGFPGSTGLAALAQLLSTGKPLEAC